jgi:hypothetical protein
MFRKFSASVIAILFCLAGSDMSAIAAPAKACDLINQQTATAIFGTPVAAGVEDMDGPSGNECRFNRPSGNASAYAGWLDASAFGPNPAAVFKVTLQQPGAQVVAVPGLGQAGYYVTKGDESSVSILYHGKVVMVGAVGSTNPGLKAAILAAAKQFMAKL